MRRGLMQRLDGDGGAIAVLASILLLVSLTASAFAIDIGILVLEQRETRKVVDLAALDAVLVFSERSDEFSEPQTGAEQIALASAAGNGFVPDDVRTLTTEIGIFDADSNTFLPGSPGANAVRVTATDRVGFHFMPSSRDYSVSATASTENLAGIAIGTGLAQLDTSQSALLNPLLSSLLGTSLSLSAVHYNGLADLDVPVGLLRTYLGVGAGGIDEFLGTDVSVASLASAFAQASPDDFGAAFDALGVLAGLNIGPATAKFPLGDILDIAASTTTGDAFADAQVNALTMLMAAAQAANRGNAVNLDVGFAVPSLTGGTLTSSTLRLAVIEPPQIAIGPARQENGQWVTVARSAQVRLAVNNSVNLGSGLLVGGLTAGSALQLPLYVGAAEGTAALTSNQCGEPGRMTTKVDTGGATLRIANPTNAQLASGAVPTGPVKLVTLRANILLLGTVNIADVFGRANVTVGAGGPTSLDFTGPFDWDNMQHTSFTSDPRAALLSDLNVYSQLLGISLTSLLTSALTSTVNNITGLTNSLLTGLVGEVVNPVLDLLGADLAGADVTAWHQECGPRVLVQ